MWMLVEMVGMKTRADVSGERFRRALSTLIG